MSNAVMKWQIVARDPEAVARFYGSLFQWKVDADNKMGYREIRSGGIEGGVWPSPPDGRDMLQLYIAVDDIDAILTKAQSMGASVIVPKTTLPDGDVMAVLVDPAGLTFGLMANRK